MADPVERAAIELYDRFTHEDGRVDRRAFMAELTRICGGAAAASAMLTSVACSAESAPIMPADDRRIHSENGSVDLGAGNIYRVYRASPAGAGWRTPAVMVIHENRGLNDYIRDVTRRLAIAGFAAEAPDLLSPAGGTPADEDRARQMIGALDPARTVADGLSLIQDFGTRSRNGRPVGILGFCWGGGMVDRLAVAAGQAPGGSPLAAAVSFYGPAPAPADAVHVQVPLLLHFAGLDSRVDQLGAPWVAALQAAHKDVTAITYPNVDHAFHNDTSAARYNREAAERAWATTLDFFRRHLRV